MPRVLIDCSYIDFARQPTGIPRVVLKYIEVGYDWGRERGVEVVPVVPSAEGLFLCRPVPGANAPPDLAEKAERSWLMPRGQGRAPRGSGLISPGIEPGPGDILFAPSYWHDVDPAIYRAIRRKGARIAILVHDILPVEHPAFYQSPWRYRFEANLIHAIRGSDALFCVSRTTRRAVEAFADRRGLTPPPVVTAYNGFDPLVSRRHAAQIRAGKIEPRITDGEAVRVLKDRQPLLMVGSIEPKKGHIPVLQCLEAMWAAGYERELVIIGRPGWLECEVVEFIEGSPFHGRRLFWLSGIDDFDLAYAYIGCRALIFASLAEGFGIPMIEASHFGKPVIVYDTPIAREVLAGVGRFFGDAASLVRALLELEMAETYSALRAAAERFTWPTWDEYSPAVFDELMKLLDGRTLADVIERKPSSAAFHPEPPRHEPASGAVHV